MSRLESGKQRETRPILFLLNDFRLYYLAPLAGNKGPSRLEGIVLRQRSIQDKEVFLRQRISIYM
jgi:hypothetical protein